MSSIRSPSPSRVQVSNAGNALADSRPQSGNISDLTLSDSNLAAGEQDTLTGVAAPREYSGVTSPDNSLESTIHTHIAGPSGILLNRIESISHQRSHSMGQTMFAPYSRTEAVCEEDNCSHISLKSEVEEDVYVPLQQDGKVTLSIDFAEMERFACAERKDHYMSNGPFNSFDSANAEKGDKEGEATRYTSYPVPLTSEDLAPAVSFGVRNTSYSTDRFCFFGTAAEDTIHASHFHALAEQGLTFDQLFSKESGTWWLDCLDPTDAEMRSICKAFGIHPLTAEDIRKREPREKVELFKNYYFVCFNSFDSDNRSEDFLDPINVYIVVFPEGVLSFHYSPIKHMPNVRRRIRQLRDYVSVFSDWICYAIIDDITDSYAPILNDVEVEADIIEDSVFIAREEDFTPTMIRISEARRKVMLLLRSLSGKKDVINMFAKRCTDQAGNAPRSEIALYLGDILDHIITMHQSLSVCETIFSRSHSNYLAQLQVETIGSNNRVTKILGRVTLVGTILLPLNFITGLWGMNVEVPGQNTQNLAWFFGILGFIVTLVIFLVFSASRWLTRAELSVSERDIPESFQNRFRRKVGHTCAHRSASARSIDSRLDRDRRV